jgi:hypothetical protein
LHPAFFQDSYNIFNLHPGIPRCSFQIFQNNLICTNLFMRAINPAYLILLSLITLKFYVKNWSYDGPHEVFFTFLS